MMISSFYMFLNYFLSLILFFNFNNSIFFWMLMEFNLISFVLILYVNKMNFVKWDSINYIIFYFLIQSSASILFLSNFCIYDWLSIFNYDVMFIFSMVFKIGLFPIFFWVFTLSEYLSITSLVFLLSFQKIPLLSALYTSNSSLFLLILFISFLIGSLTLFYSSSLLSMFICSSISYSFMLFFLYILNIYSFISFFLLYSLFLFFCLVNILNSGSGLYPNLVLISSYVFFLGLPPFGLFFYKFIFSGAMYDFMGMSEMLLFWFFSFISLLGYIKFFSSSFLFQSHLSEVNSPLSKFSGSLLFFCLLFLTFSLL